MNERPLRPGGWRRALQAVAATRLSADLMARGLHRLDRWLLRLSRGRISAPALLGLPVVALTTIGAKSGRPRTVPLVGIPHRGGLILVASNWGQASYPAWYFNARANPRVLIARDGRTAPFTAREVAGAEYEACWERAVAAYRGYLAYRERVGGARHIPILLLTPAASERMMGIEHNV